MAPTPTLPTAFTKPFNTEVDLAIKVNKLASPVISISADPIISPVTSTFDEKYDVLEAFISLAFMSHLLSACPKTLPFAVGSMLLITLATTFATSAEPCEPITVFPSIDASVTTLKLFTFASADTSTSACAVISPDALIVFAF